MHTMHAHNHTTYGPIQESNPKLQLQFAIYIYHIICLSVCLSHNKVLNLGQVYYWTWSQNNKPTLILQQNNVQLENLAP